MKSTKFKIGDRVRSRSTFEEYTIAGVVDEGQDFPFPDGGAPVKVRTNRALEFVLNETVLDLITEDELSLRLCPFCNSPDTILKMLKGDYWGYEEPFGDTYIECRTCRATGPKVQGVLEDKANMEQAQTLWNKIGGI